jgi:putative tryptophan/tyrosine transport system substrate-binding protein
MMRRRDFMTLLGGAAAAWPLAAGAQQSERPRRVGVLMNVAADDPLSTLRVSAFAQAMQELGWTVGRNLRIEYRWGQSDLERLRKYAAELVALTPDVIVSNATPSTTALQQATRSVPVVFVNQTDPVGAGFIESLARPGGNMTGFTNFEFGLGAKWLELLKEIAPRVTRVAVLRDPAIASGTGQLGAIQSVAPSFGVDLRPVDIRNAGELERALTAFAGLPNGGMIVTGSGYALSNQSVIVTLATRYGLPTVSSFRTHVENGVLLSYAPDVVDPFRRAAGYVDRILKGEKPADLAVQAPVKFELAVNLKTAKALGITVPDTLLARADEVIE